MKMDHETLFTATKWELLRLLEVQARSPLELAELTGYSLANVSQQLRLLEMAGLIESRRVPNRDKGQPRVLYSLAGNNCYIISTADSLVKKKRLEFSTTNKIQLKIWFLENPEARAFIEKAFWRLEGSLSEIAAIAVDIDSLSPVSLYVVPKAERLSMPDIQELRRGKTTRQLVVTQLDAAKLREIADQLYVLYDPGKLLRR